MIGGPPITDAAQDAAVAAGRDIAAGPRVALLHLARGENLLLLDQHQADAVLAVLVRPDARGDEIDRIDQVLGAVIADHAVRTLGRVPAQRQRRVQQQVQPVERLFDARTALRPDRAGIVAARQRGLHDVDDPRQAKTRRMLAEMRGTVWEEILAERLGLECRPRRYRCAGRPAAPSCSRTPARRGRSPSRHRRT